METAPWTMIFPGLAIVISVLGLNLLGDGLRDVLDPRMSFDRYGRCARGRGAVGAPCRAS